MKKLVDVWYALSYRLENHYLGQISLRNWLWAWVIVPPVLAVFKQLAWWYAVPLSAIGIALWTGTQVAQRKGYLHFAPGPVDLESSLQQSIAVDEKVAVRVCGNFAVGNCKRLMLNEPAFYTFVKTREHILMAHLKRTRFLLLARSRQIEAGWWYVFFKPEQIVSVQTGYIASGFRSYPGLALTFRPAENASTATVYVVCEERDAFKRILDDLWHIAPPQAFASLAA
ncbi:MAG: hypothetical protein JW934_24010 [Anaerolineae bacterium]|nr:hypothetical protein [Anaerolineae bacterium]